MAPHNDPITYFAETDARNTKVKFGIKASDRTRHVYIIGKTGMGKSTTLENMAVQDIQSGAGMAFIDPHGKTADLLLEYVPKDRIKDVIYFAPFDLDSPISFNVMEDVGYDKRHLVVSGLMSAFKKIWKDAWSARMEYILSNTILALLEFPDSTLLGVNQMLANKGYRETVVRNVSDPAVKAFWMDEFANYGDRLSTEASSAIQNKVGQFTSNPMIRNIIGQSQSSFDIRKVMDEKKILIVNLSKGRVGEVNANLLGSMLITKIYLAAMSRADVSGSALAKLPNFYLYVDEFQSFANESFADILSEARKYKLNLTIAHQYIEQMSPEVVAAVFGNVGTMISFRVGARDAEVLEKEFAPQFTAEDLVNLGFVQIYLKLMIDGVSSHPFSARTLPPIEKPLISFREDIMLASRTQFAQPRAKVETAIKDWLNTKFPTDKEFKQGEKQRDGVDVPLRGPDTFVSSDTQTQNVHVGGNKSERQHADALSAQQNKPRGQHGDKSGSDRGGGHERRDNREHRPRQEKPQADKSELQSLVAKYKTEALPASDVDVTQESLLPKPAQKAFAEHIKHIGQAVVQQGEQKEAQPTQGSKQDFKDDMRQAFAKAGERLKGEVTPEALKKIFDKE